MEYLKDIAVFLWAVINNWAGYTTGGLVVAVVGLWSTVKKITVPRKYGIALALGFLFFAFFNAWRDQYLKTIPRLTLHIEDTYIGGYPNDPDDTAFLLLVSVTNAYGPPSIADNWKMQIKIPGYNSPIDAIGGQPFDPNLPVTAELNNGQRGVYSASDDLREKLIQTPIAQGARVVGIIPFVVKNTKKSEIYKPQTILTLSCKDVAGNEIKGSHILKGRGEPLQWYPGLKR